MSAKPAKPLLGRFSGGIALLGTTNAQSRMDWGPVIAKDSVSVGINGLRVSGVYLPPSMPVALVESVLDGLSASSIILGDINTRFSGTLNHGKQPPRP